MGPHAEAKLAVKITPNKAGQKELIAEFDSKELADINGSMTVHVKPAEKPETNMDG